MSSVTILFGVLLTLLGLAGYFLTATSSLTALIPAFFGLLLLVLGVLARSDAVRIHAMHAASAVGLVGFIAALFSLLRSPWSLLPAAAVYSEVAMLLLTGVFEALCIRSFIVARRARTARSS